MNGGPLPKQTKAGLDVAEYNTRLTPLPPSHILTADASRSALQDSWKPLNEKEEEELLQFMKKDGEYTKTMSIQAQRNNAILLKKIQRIRPVGWLHWWERGADEDQSQLGKDGPFRSFKILLPAEKRLLRAPNGSRSALFPSMSTKQITLERQSAATYEEDLVPVRLEIEHEGWSLRDTFTWPAAESYKNEMIDRFAVMLCDDFGLPTAHFVPAIRENILSQVSDHTAAVAIRPLRSKRKREEAMGRGRLSKEELNWWKQWRKHIEASEHDEQKIVELNQEDHTGVEIAANHCGQEPEAELRIQIKLDITVGAMNLVDQFEWDVSDEGNAAESFASVFTAELGLSGEFKTAIAHSIREQVDVYTRSLALVGYTFDGKELFDDELREPLLSTVGSITRSQQDIEIHTPKLMQLSELEILHSERERDKESRRKRRQTRGRRGVNLPDREPLKTARTAAVCGLQQGNNQSNDGINGNTDLLGHTMSQGRSAAMGIVAGSGRGGAGISTRRAAAAAANASIAPHSSMHDYGTPTPAPEGHTTTISLGRQGSKRRKLESQKIHFEFPGGLGRHDENESRGPKFAPSLGITTSKGEQQHQTAKLGNAPSKTASAHLNQVHSHVQSFNPASVIVTTTTTTTTPSTPVAWNMAKPEEAANQQSNWHDGQWYCSNCGVPGSIDGSRRKGPLGDKTLCGICGKFFHRHRKARPVEYTRDIQHHRKELALRGIRSENIFTDDSTQPHSAADSPANLAAAPASLSTAAHVSVDEQATAGILAPAVSTTAAAATPQSTDIAMKNIDTATATPVTKTFKVENKENSFPNTRGNSPDLPFEQVGSPDDSDNSDVSRPTSPIKKSISETPRSVSPNKVFSLSLSQVAQDSPIGSTSPQQASSISIGQASNLISASPPDWLSQACHALRLRFPLDRFEVQLRPRPAGVPTPSVPEWRVRCQDCPGKLYTPGPGESLTNFEIHLRNRAHRAAVQKSVQVEGRKPYGS